MTRSRRILSAMRRFGRDESGTTLVEMAIVLPLFLVLLFGLIDFGRFSYQVVMSDKAMQIAARIASVRPPACPGVPATNARGTSIATPPAAFGTTCSAGDGICAQGSYVCVGDADDDTAAEIFSRIAGVLPAEAQIEHLLFRYEIDDTNRRMNFLGGPYTPTVTVELVTDENDDDVLAQLPSGFEPIRFRFVHPLSGLLRMTGAVPFPSMSASLPGEDLGHGIGG